MIAAGVFLVMLLEKLGTEFHGNKFLDLWQRENVMFLKEKVFSPYF